MTVFPLFACLVLAYVDDDDGGYYPPQLLAAPSFMLPPLPKRMSQTGRTSFSPTCTEFILNREENGAEIAIVDRVGLKPLVRLKTEYMASTAFTPDGTRLVNLRLSQRKPDPDEKFKRILVEVRDPRTLRLLLTIHLADWEFIRDRGDYARSEFLVADDILVVRSPTAIAAVYDLRTGAKVGEITGKYRLRHLALSRDGRWILTSGEDKILRTYDARTLKLDRDLYEHAEAVEAVAISPDGRYCASAARGSGIRVFDRTTAGVKAHDRRDRDGHSLQKLAFLADGKTVVASSPSYLSWRPADCGLWSLLVWRWADDEARVLVSTVAPEKLRRWPGLAGPLSWPPASTPDGKMLYIWSDCALAGFDLSTAKRLPPAKPPARPKVDE